MMYFSVDYLYMNMLNILSLPYCFLFVCLFFLFVLFCFSKVTFLPTFMHMYLVIV